MPVYLIGLPFKKTYLPDNLYLGIKTGVYLHWFTYVHKQKVIIAAFQPNCSKSVFLNVHTGYPEIQSLCRQMAQLTRLRFPSVDHSVDNSFRSHFYFHTPYPSLLWVIFHTLGHLASQRFTRLLVSCVQEYRHNWSTEVECIHRFRELYGKNSQLEVTAEDRVPLVWFQCLIGSSSFTFYFF